MPDSNEDEFAEFETDEPAFHAMMKQADPAVLVRSPFVLHTSRQLAPFLVANPHLTITWTG